MSELECVWTYIAELSFPCPGLRYWLINVPKKKKKKKNRSPLRSVNP